jgi:DNA-binding XRE family transcriptional regulator
MHLETEKVGKIADVLKKLMKETNTTQAQMAKRLGAKTQSVIAQRLKRENPNIDTVFEMLDEIGGYELVIRKKRQGKRPEGEYLIGRYTKKDDDNDEPAE